MRVSATAATHVSAAGPTTAKRHPATPSRNAASAVESTPPTCCEVAQSPIAVPRCVGENQGLRTLTCSGYARLCATPFTPHANASGPGVVANANDATETTLSA